MSAAVSSKPVQGSTTIEGVQEVARRRTEAFFDGGAGASHRRLVKPQAARVGQGHSRRDLAEQDGHGRHAWPLQVMEGVLDVRIRRDPGKGDASGNQGRIRMAHSPQDLGAEASEAQGIVFWSGL